jgi:hypothetical protein
LFLSFNYHKIFFDIKTNQIPYLLFDLRLRFVAYTVLSGFGEEFIFFVLLLTHENTAIFSWNSLLLLVAQRFFSWTWLWHGFSRKKSRPIHSRMEQKKESPPPWNAESQWRNEGPPTRDGATLKGTPTAFPDVSFVSYVFSVKYTNILQNVHFVRIKILKVLLN